MSNNGEHEIGLPARSADAFLVRLAERLGASAQAQAVFAPSVEKEGVTVIPVAKVLWGLGGGSGRRKEDEGGGGGGGVIATPVGFIEIKGGQTRFRPILDSATRVALVAVGGVAACLFLRGLRGFRGS